MDERDYKAPNKDIQSESKIFVCHCKNCRHVKAKRKNRKLKKVIKRLMNKRRRKTINKAFNWYWS